MNLSFNAGVLIEKDIYFSDRSINALMKLNIESGICQFIGQFPQENADTKLLHRDAFVYGERIIFCPDQGNNIHTYNLSYGTFESFRIYKSNQSRYRFSHSLLFDGHLWIFPGNIVQPIISFDVVNNKYAVHASIEDSIDKSIIGSFPKNGVAIENASVIDNNAYMALTGTNRILKFDFETKKIDTFESNVGDCNFLYSYDSVLWVCSNEYIYKFTDKLKEKRKVMINGQFTHECSFIIISSKNEYFMISMAGGYIYAYDANLGEFKKIETAYIDQSSRYSRGYLYENYLISQSEVILFPPYGKNVQIFNVDRREVRVIKSEIIKDNVYKKIYKECILKSKDKVHYEGEFDLSEFVDALVSE